MAIFLNTTIKSYDWFEPSEKHKVHILQYLDTFIVGFERYHDNRIIINGLMLRNSGIPLRGGLYFGMSKNEFCSYLGIPYLSYKNEDYIFIMPPDEGQGTYMYFYFNDKNMLVGIKNPRWFDDQVFIDQY